MRALLDANVLYGQFPRYLLLSLATRGLLEPRWSEAVLREMVDALQANGLPRKRIAEQVEKLHRDWPEALVDPTKAELPPDFSLPDPDDVHVVRAAVASDAPVILTFNLDDFPTTSLAPLGLRAESPGAWCRTRWDDACAVGAATDFLEALRGHRETLKRPAPWTRDKYHAALKQFRFGDLADVLLPGQL